GLQATQARVKALEAEVEIVLRTGGAVPASKGKNRPTPTVTPQPGSNREPTTVPQANPILREATLKYSNWLRGQPSQPADDPLAQAEAALRAIRESSDTVARQRAADALERALKSLKEREQPNKATPIKPGNN